MPRLIATWNPARSAWETPRVSALCGHLVPFCQTWPASGTMRNGSVSEQTRSAPAIGGSESSSSPGPLFRTPTSQLAVNGGSQHPDKRRAGGHGPTLADEVEFLLPTPDTGHSLTGHGRRGGKAGNGHQSGASLEHTVKLLPTPAANDTGNPPEDHLRKKPGRSQVTSLQCIADYGLIPTGGRLDGEGGGLTYEAAQDWGPYEPAIWRQEQAFGHPVPPPTQPTGRDGAYRLSPAFVEWMMGLAPGHVTGLASKCLPHGSLPRPGCPECRKGLSRSAQLKLLGNGVVPQQAEAALRLLMERALGADAEEKAS